ncbi:TlyA family RNA methyltransferase [Desulfurispira natronophila]|uniref:23S rRNA (Cytidine1920-2'-O)/16S rRNA (Cytidine1409-2'-O)-methyltransferase n=1 Tax=Desulfurispira natronophila TaxID=682562 RepID=A0A7W8DHP3_9BACT|nr:TlyA family RNA methyltransferase [Desulfurispira natronophila]MBB5022695.1 23S rRNA (cytidine1920-2'-O)/16S rRNA (cytidine1409-2'-O)-methyltransferase [Desulfurispira natronophila]
MATKTAGKVRLDRLLVDRQLAQSRERARALIMAGAVIVDDHRRDKAGDMVSPTSTIRLKGSDIPYVSRGGLKLQQALESFHINPQGWVCMDIGSSTGGFTDCLLQNGAEVVHAVDVGTNQLDWRLRNHPQVILQEQTDIRRYNAPPGTTFDLIVTDVSFISLARIFDPISQLAITGTYFIGLVKPQFELEREKIGKGGIVRRDEYRLEALHKVVEQWQTHGLWEVLSYEECQTHGTDGNVEYILLARRT